MRLTSQLSVPKTLCSNVDRDANYLDTLCVTFLTAPPYKWLDTTSQSQRNNFGWQPPHKLQNTPAFQRTTSTPSSGYYPKFGDKVGAFECDTALSPTRFHWIFWPRKLQDKRTVPSTSLPIHSLATSHRTTQRCITADIGNGVKKQPEQMSIERRIYLGVPMCGETNMNEELSRETSKWQSLCREVYSSCICWE